MQLRITKNNEKIVLMHGDEPVEDYSLSDSIDFSGFMSFLLNNDLNERIDFDNLEFEPKPNEEPLIKVLNIIKDNYNKRVDEYKSFVSNQLKEEAL